MNCDHEDEHGGRSPTGSKSSFREDDPQVHSVTSISTFQNSFNTSVQRKRATNNVLIYFIESSDEKDLESTRTRLKDSELSPTDELSGKENSCLISALSKVKPVAFGKYPSHYLSFFKLTSKELYYFLLIIRCAYQRSPSRCEKAISGCS